MMDFHILIIISCVFLASLFSLLFINKFFRRKTFEEIIAEKRAMTEKLNAQHKAAPKKPKATQQKLKKELKREKRQQRQKEQEQEQEELDLNGEEALAAAAAAVQEEMPPSPVSSHASVASGMKAHVEFEPEPEVLTYSSSSNNNEKENGAGATAAQTKSKSKRELRKQSSNASKTGILINKNEPVLVKENILADEKLNNFEVKPPKDVIELKKHEKERKDEKSLEKTSTNNNKKEKHAKKHSEKSTAAPPTVTAPIAAVVEQVQVLEPAVAKELKQQDDKQLRHGSPKTQQTNSKSKQQTRKQQKESLATKELVHALDKLSETDTISVTLLMNLFRRAELNRSEIQLLIDYLLNKQQDMPASHSEWSDDICQKLKRQLEEKERALGEAQAVANGFQAKLRELRLEINSERANISVVTKSYVEKLQSKEQELTGLSQEVQALGEKLTHERQQFQTKLLREKQASTQELLAQLQLLQAELTRKDQCVAELTCMVNASRQAVEESQQKNDIIQTQAQQIRTLEQQRDELEQVSNGRIYELEQAKTLETENEEYKVEIRNLQNALESAKGDVAQARSDLDAQRNELGLARNVELGNKQNQIAALQTRNEQLMQQLAGISNKTEEQQKEQSDMQLAFDARTTQLAQKEQQLAALETQQGELLQQLNVAERQRQELQQRVDVLQEDVSSKHRQLQEVEQTADQRRNGREQELLQQLQEQKERNNQQEQLLAAAASSTPHAVVASASVATSTSGGASANANAPHEQQHVRELFQRLYPNAVKACAGTALSLPFDQWLEQVLATHVKQSLATTNNTATTITANTASNTNISNANSSCNKSTQSTNSSSSSGGGGGGVGSGGGGGGASSNHHNSHTNINNNDTNTNNNSLLLLNSESATNNNSNSRINSTSNSGGGDGAPEVQQLYTQNAQLRAKIDELTKLITKTNNTLSELEGHARAQEEHWRTVVRGKDELIYKLQHSNGEQQDI